MQTKYNDNVLDYWKLPNGNCIVKMKKDEGLDSDIHLRNILRYPLGAVIWIILNETWIILLKSWTNYSNLVYFTEMQTVYSLWKNIEMF